MFVIDFARCLSLFDCIFFLLQGLEPKPKIDAPSGSEHEPTPEQFDEMLSMVN